MDPCENIDLDIIPNTKKQPTWLEATLQDAERIKVPEGTSRKSKRSKRFSSYATYLTKLLDEEPTTFEEAVKKAQWKEAMAKEHQSIMKNEVWEIVPRPKEKSVVTSNGYTRSNMQQTKAWINIRQDSWLEGSPKRREKTMMKPLPRWQDIPPSELLYLLLLPWDGIYTRWM